MIVSFIIMEHVTHTQVFPATEKDSVIWAVNSSISCPSSNGEEDLQEHSRGQPSGSVSLTIRCMPALPGLPCFTGTSDFWDGVCLNMNEVLTSNLSE